MSPYDRGHRMTEAHFWKTHPNINEFSRNRSSSSPDVLQKLNRYLQKMMDEFSRNRSSPCPGNGNFGKISEWVLQDFQIRFNLNRLSVRLHYSVKPILETPFISEISHSEFIFQLVMFHRSYRLQVFQFFRNQFSPIQFLLRWFHISWSVRWLDNFQQWNQNMKLTSTTKHLLSVLPIVSVRVAH